MNEWDSTRTPGRALADAEFGPGLVGERGEPVAVDAVDGVAADGLGGLEGGPGTGPDRPGMPSGADPWDARSGEWLAGAPDDVVGGKPSTGAASTTSARVLSAEAATRPAARVPSDIAHGTGDATGRTDRQGQPLEQVPGSPDVPAGQRSVREFVSPAASAEQLAQAPGTAPAPHAVPDARAGASTPRRAAAPRRGSVDPVKSLLHRHRELCERAVDPLEIAAGLEAHGVTDRTAARFRHRDVFSLAEELYARVPRTAESRPEAEPLPVPRVRVGWVLLVLLPGALGAATVTGLRLTQGHFRGLVALGGVLAVALATRAALRHGPLAGPPGRRAWGTTVGTRAWTLWLFGYALAGDGLLHAVLTGGPDTPPTTAPDGPWPTATAPVLALLVACAPAAWSAHLLAAGARRRLARSRGLEDFTEAARPLLLGVLALFLGALAALLALCGALLHTSAAYPQALTLGALLLLARLLTVHRHRHAPALALGAAAATEAVALALPLAGRLPGCAFLAVPVETLAGAWGEAAVPALACGTAALALLWHAGRTLTQASAHAPTGAPD
ncbi:MULTISPECIES: hypothetical protein [unclassified Streptomyces]|uniref:hypothetical protein n=1 Tax=unclassified Streptomyces TaxID=2593676 RepID=UPI000A6F6A57